MGWRITSICSKLLIMCKSIDSWVDMTPYFQLPWQIIFQRGIEKIFFFMQPVKNKQTKKTTTKKPACEIKSNNNCKNNKNKVKGAQLWPTLCDSMNDAVQGILQVRILEWVDYPFSSGSSLPRNRTGVSCIAGRFFTNWTIRGSPSVQFSSLQSLSRVWLFATPWIAAHQASLSITNSWSLLKLMPIESVMPSSHHPLSPPSPPAPNPYQHQGLFQWVNSLHEVAKVLGFQLQHQSFQWTPRIDLL